MSRVIVVGVGGAGIAALTHIRASGLDAVSTLAADTHVSTIAAAEADYHLLLGDDITHGHGAGGNPALGRRAALADQGRILDALSGANRVLVMCGLGGGTGGGAASVIAQTVGAEVIVASMPFTFEGEPRRQAAIRNRTHLNSLNIDIVTLDNNGLIPLLRHPDRLSLTQAYDHASRMLAWHVLTRLTSQ